MFRSGSSIVQFSSSWHIALEMMPHAGEQDNRAKEDEPRVLKSSVSHIHDQAVTTGQTGHHHAATVLVSHLCGCVNER